MAGRVRFVCLLHSHQPVGNFDNVIEEAYKLSYLPYVEVFEQFPQIPLTNHYSGCLLEWLDAHHPEYIQRLKRNCQPEGANRPAWEMIGGGIDEPIMTMLPTRDRLGQIQRMSDFIQSRFGARPRGLWLPERVWEPALVRDLAEAGVKYMTLDDNHFKAAGLEDRQLVGGFVTEDQGRIVQVYPASERLRYLLPYAPVHECMEWLRSAVPADGERVVCYADDGEKFGVWPRTYQHVYNDGWLRNFLGAIQHAQNEGWLVCSTLGDAYDLVEPVGQVCLPENSYREMTEWALPSARLASYENALHSLKQEHQIWEDNRVQNVLGLVKGGNWRSFKIKYPEGNRMYAKMMEVSAKVAALANAAAPEVYEEARTQLYRGQCNCPYWHGVFGGMYLPHLRSAVYSALIKADNIAENAANSSAINCTIYDFDFDAEPEVRLSNNLVSIYLHARRGGHLYEFDLRDIAFNVGDTFSRRFEAYHEKVARAVVGDSGEAASIHDLVLAKEAGLADLLKYDTYLRESLVDHLSPVELTTDHFLSGAPPSDPGFRTDVYDIYPVDSVASTNRREVDMIRQGFWNNAELQITKRISMEAGKAGYAVEYTISHISGAPVDGFFAVEMNYSLLAGEAHDRYYYHQYNDNAGKLATVANFGTLSYIGLKDHWLNVALSLNTTVPANVLVSPVKTVSQSEGGFESVYQSSCVVLQWSLKLSAGQAMKLKLVQEKGRARE